MSHLAKTRDGVRISFREPLMVDSVMDATVTYPTYAGAESTKLPKVYWRTELQTTWTPIVGVTPVQLAAGIRWVELALARSPQDILLGSELDTDKFDGHYVVSLTADDLDPQFLDFGTRNYEIKVGRWSLLTANNFTQTHPAGSGTNSFYAPNAYQARIWLQRPLVKPRRIKWFDVNKGKLADNQGLAALNAKYPPDPAATSAPWSFISNALDTKTAWTCGNNMANLKFTSNVMDELILPIGTRLVIIAYAPAANEAANALAAQQAAGWTAATKLFDEVIMESYDHGPYSPMFLGKDISFDDQPLIAKAEYP